YTSMNDFHDGVSDDDYFGRIEGLTEEFFLTNASSGIIANSIVPYSGWNGDFYYAAEDVNDIGGVIGAPDGVDFKDVTFSNIDISNGAGLNFYGLFATGENDPCGSSVYDGTDFVEVYYNVDGGGEVLALCFNADIECNIPADVTNEPLYMDPNCDGDGGEGTLLTSTFAEFTFAIPDGTSLDLRIRVRMDAGSEEFAFDYFRVEADNLLGLSDTILVNNISLFPNPSNGSVTINKSNDIVLKQLEIYSIIGKKVNSFNLEKMGNSKSFDFEALSSGIYLLKLRSIDGQIVTKKLIIEKR
ncbi:MAG: T9SS type A sorting domain-containing protein, partial [Bacteroidia bacterium]|nr:T9SS type A sorting domain-containing protein [Bacteroidia bacterium]